MFGYELRKIALYEVVDELKEQEKNRKKSSEEIQEELDRLEDIR